MPAVKVPRKSTPVDMTAMCDVAFLLLSFFILTTKFRPDEPVQVATPSSTSVANPKERGLITITVSPDNRIFFDIDNQNVRKELARKMAENYGIQFSEDQLNAFALGSSIGVPMSEIQGFLELTPEDRKQYLASVCRERSSRQLLDCEAHGEHDEQPAHEMRPVAQGVPHLER